MSAPNFRTRYESTSRDNQASHFFKREARIFMFRICAFRFASLMNPSSVERIKVDKELSGLTACLFTKISMNLNPPEL